MISDKELKVKCRNLINEYEDILLYIVEQKEQQLGKGIAKIRDKDTLNLLRKVSFQQGLAEGGRAYLAEIYKLTKD